VLAAMEPASASVAGLIRIGAMELYADLSQRAVLDTNALAWMPSPMAGVERRILDRRGEEVARAARSWYSFTRCTRLINSAW